MEKKVKEHDKERYRLKLGLKMKMMEKSFLRIELRKRWMITGYVDSL